MTCPKCNKETLVEWVYCPFCQNPLKAKCTECGRMERVGRAVCETAFKIAEKERIAFISMGIRNLPGVFSTQATLFSFLYVALFTFGCVLILLGALARPKIFQWILAGSTLFIASIPVFVYARKKYIANEQKMKIDAKNANQEFFRLHPEYAEIIKKAEGK